MVNPYLYQKTWERKLVSATQERRGAVVGLLVVACTPPRHNKDVVRLLVVGGRLLALLAFVGFVGFVGVLCVHAGWCV